MKLPKQPCRLTHTWLIQCMPACLPACPPPYPLSFCPADEGANPAHVAADLLSQAEHGPDSQVVLLALPGVDLDAVQLQVQKQCDELPRNETARKALSHSCIVQVCEGGMWLGLCLAGVRGCATGYGMPKGGG
jgi:hypothetical protein